MSDMLSQSEIDALLQAMLSGGAPVEEKKECESKEKPAHRVDFKLPKKLKKDELEKVKKFTEKFVWELSVYYSSKLNIKGNFGMELLSMELLNFADFNNGITDNSIIFVIDMGCKTNCMYMEMPLMLCSALSNIPKTQPICSLSPGNTKKILSTGEKIRSIFEDVFHNNCEPQDVQVKLRSMENIKTFIPSVYYSETVGLLILKVTIGELVSQINICMPFSSLNYICSTFNTVRIEDTLTFEQLSDMGVDVQFMLGRTSVYLSDLERIHVGDLILLDSRVKDSNIEVIVGDSALYNGRLGATEDRYVVKITEKR